MGADTKSKVFFVLAAKSVFAVNSHHSGRCLWNPLTVQNPPSSSRDSVIATSPCSFNNPSFLACYWFLIIHLLASIILSYEILELIFHTFLSSYPFIRIEVPKCKSPLSIFLPMKPSRYCFPTWSIFQFASSICF